MSNHDLIDAVIIVALIFYNNNNIYEFLTDNMLNVSCSVDFKTLDALIIPHRSEEPQLS